MTTTITHHAATAAALLARAESIGLPLPNSVRVSKLGVHLGLSTLADLTDWVAWLEAPPVESKPVRDHDTRLAHRAEAVVDGVEVTVWHVSERVGPPRVQRLVDRRGRGERPVNVWKPGDVAMVTVPNGTQHMAARTFDDGWFCLATGDPTCPVVEAVRPLVVLDPEDDKQVDRLLEAIGIAGLGGRFISDHVRRGLLSLVTPPKPDAPTGLGAVVEDADGERWVWMAVGAEGAHWHRVGIPARRTNYANVSAVRVLSEGVQ